MVLKDPYAKILKIVKAVEKKDEIKNPYNVGDILCACRPVDGSIHDAYQVIKVTKTGVKIQRIAVKDGNPVRDDFTDLPVQRRVVKSKWSDWVGVYMNNWQLHKKGGL